MSPRTPGRIDVVVVGELNVDLILSGPGAVPRFGQVETLLDGAGFTLGSSSAITACGLARLGRPTTIVGVVGDDLLGPLVREGLETHGVDTSAVVIDPDVATGLTVVLNPGGDARALLTHLGSIGLTRADHVPAGLLRDARLLHVGSLFLQRSLLPDLAALFDAAHAGGLLVSVDPNWDPSEQWSALDPLYGRIDVLFANETEAAALTGMAEPGDAARLLAGRLREGGIAVVKRGPDGAVAARGAASWSEPTLPVSAVDTTGAGDSFAAGFLDALLDHGDVAQALAAGVVCGALSTRARGGTGAQPDRAELTNGIAALRASARRPG